MVLGGAPYSAALPLALLVLLGMFSLKAVTFPFRLPLQYQRG
jgi:hypothetical protein